MSDYNPQKLEKKWQDYWEKKGFFKADDHSEKEKYYALVEFPYPSGSGLHLGHCFNYVLLDFFARKKRMEGKNVLSPIGWDAFGLPTENFAIRTGIHPIEATKKNTDNFRRQMKNLGLGFNWDREINTTDPGYYKWTQWIFREMFKHGLAYKEKMDINWCPSCKIGLANEEVIDGTCERCGAEVEQRKISQWLLKITAYADRLIDELDLVDFDESIVSAQRNWIGRSRGAEIDFPLVSCEGTVSVFTTRPDTLGGTTFFVLAPEHPKVFELTTSENEKRVKKYVEEAKNKMDLERKSQDREKTGVPTGGFVKNPLTGEKIPVFVADYVMMDYGTGALMGVPAHDERDFAFAKKHGLEIREVIKPDFENQKKCFSGEGKVVNTEGYNGMNSEDAREKIIQDLKEKELALKAVDYHLRDWIFSRQHYWGEPIPMVYCEKCAEEGKTYWDVYDFKPKFSPSEDLAGWFPISKEELPLELPKVKNYEPTDTGESPLAEMKDWVKTKCPHCGGPAERETDTMPNWAGSSWYYLRYCDPGNDKDLAKKERLKYWMPVDIYIGGAEHTTLHLLYSRFWHKFLNDIGKVPGKEPYLRRRNRGLILGEDHRKMSKSKGNYILPGEIIEKYGADALRTYLAFVGPYDGTFPWQDSGVKGVFRFLSRLYSFAEEKIKKEEETEEKLKRKLHRLVRDVGEDIDKMKFNTAVAKMMEFLNEAEGEKFSLKDLKKLLKLVAPFAPHLAEEFWSAVGKSESIHKSSWPSYSEKKAEKKEITLIIQVNGKVRGKVKIDVGLSEEEAEKKALKEERTKKWLKEKSVKKTVYVPDKLINFVTD